MTTTPSRTHLPLTTPNSSRAERGRILTWLTAAGASIIGALGFLIACAACCVPILISAGLLTGAAATGLKHLFLGAGAALMLLAGALLLLRRRRARRTGHSGCGSDCAC